MRAFFSALCLILAATAAAAPASIVSLSPAERSFLQAHPVIRIQMCRNCPPFEYRADGEDRGLAHDLLVLAAAKAGFSVAVSDLTWSPALESLQRGEDRVDVILAISPSPERARYLLFTRPYVSYPQVIFTRKDEPWVGSLADLRGRRVAVEKDYLVEGWLRRDLGPAAVAQVDSTADALEALSSGKAEAYVGNLATATYVLGQRGLLNLKVAAPSPYGNEDFALGVRRSAPGLASALQKGLDAVAEDERRAVERRYLAVRYEHGLRPWDLGLWLLVLAAAAGLFIVQLRRMVAARTRELAAEGERRAAAEAQLNQARRLESLGTLAGGIAHDFNNVLAGVGSYLQLVRQRLPGGDRALHYDLSQAELGLRRAADLVRQILAFSRRQPQDPRPVRLDETVAEALDLLRPTLPKGIGLESALHSRALVMADPAQLHRVAMNLFTNAVHAMGERGRLKVSVEDRVEGGRGFVRLSVEDSGGGVPAEIVDHIFEPFFSARESGQGTGMGLAVVHGVVTAHGGRVRLENRPGRGACFQVDWPRLGDALPSAAPSAALPSAGVDGVLGLRVLFVDDEPMLTDAAVRLLERLGMRVDGHKDPAEALRVFREQPDAYDVAVLDRSMPGMDGLELAGALRRSRPALPIVLCSGYQEQPVAAGPGRPVDRVFEKPLAMRDLAEAISELVQARAPGAGKKEEG